ncbi:ABC transporter substrate-binding protein [Limoniibacter endophyticus]|uniref:ABC transporter substrate-binding protein n=1 Tax=Limoniibacter endophyticus TaxID=1565040 RepID=A0A8J3GH93_9HYPH|nr:ABC transporter substrate-binding protein [Limoniibacter endophyticus]GHC77275.1 ABC transporter substrate-binding protein [Limoniibacter endophyticus]
MFFSRCGSATAFAISIVATLYAAPAALAGGNTVYPLTVENCGRQVAFEKAPERVVAVGQSTAEILYLLGLAGKVVGTAVWVGPVLSQYKEVNDGIPRLADNSPSFESVVEKKPDLVAAQFQWNVGPEGVVATPDQFAELGINVYNAPADCKGKDNEGGGDGVRMAAFDMTLIYQEIQELAEIFDVRERGETLVQELRIREAAAREKAIRPESDVSAVFWFSSAELDIDPYVAGKYGAPAYIMSAFGIRNIIDSNEEWPTVGWETIAKADPTVIVVGKMGRRRFPADDVTVKREFLATDPVASLMTATRKNYVIEMDAQAMNPTIRTIEGIEILAEALTKLGLSH